MIEPIPLIDKTFTLVIQEERQRSLEFNVSSLVESIALAVKNQGFNEIFGFRAMMARIIKGILGKEGLCVATMANLATSWRNAIS